MQAKGVLGTWLTSPRDQAPGGVETSIFSWQLRDKLRADKYFNYFNDKTIIVVLEPC